MSLRSPYKILFRSLFLSALAIGAASAQTKDNYPNRAIKIVVPFPPGGATDIIARVNTASYRELPECADQ